MCKRSFWKEAKKKVNNVLAPAALMKEEQVIRMMQIQYSARPFWLGCARFWRVADSILFLQKKINIFLTKWKQSRTHAPSIYTIFFILIDPYVNWISDWQMLVKSSSKTTSSTTTSSQPPAWGRAPSCDCNCSPDRQPSSRGLPRKREKASKREKLWRV